MAVASSCTSLGSSVAALVNGLPAYQDFSISGCGLLGKRIFLTCEKPCCGTCGVFQNCSFVWLRCFRLSFGRGMVARPGLCPLVNRRACDRTSQTAGARSHEHRGRLEKGRGLSALQRIGENTRV